MFLLSCPFQVFLYDCYANSSFVKIDETDFYPDQNTKLVKTQTCILDECSYSPDTQYQRRIFNFHTKEIPTWKSLMSNSESRVHDRYLLFIQADFRLPLDCLWLRITTCAEMSWNLLFYLLRCNQWRGTVACYDFFHRSCEDGALPPRNVPPVSQLPIQVFCNDRSWDLRFAHAFIQIKRLLDARGTQQKNPRLQDRATDTIISHAIQGCFPHSTRLAWSSLKCARDLRKNLKIYKLHWASKRWQEWRSLIEILLSFCNQSDFCGYEVVQQSAFSSWQ